MTNVAKALERDLNGSLIESTPQVSTAKVLLQQFIRSNKMRGVEYERPKDVLARRIVLAGLKLGEENETLEQDQ